MFTPILPGLNGTNNDHITINAALALNDTIILEGTYNISGEILVPYTGGTINAARKVIFCSNATINSASNNITLLHWAASFGAILGTLKIVTSGTGNTLMHISPELYASNVAVVHQLSNYFENIVFNGGDDQLVLMCGVPIGGVGCGCYYNQFHNIRFSNGKRAIWFKDNGSVSAVNSGSNSNRFFGTVINGSTNTGIQIDAGGDNEFFSYHGENITLGSSPNATPSAIKIAATMASGGTNDYNYFNGVFFENVTRQLENHTTLTAFAQHNLNPSLCTGSAYLDRDAGGTAGTGIAISSGVISCDVGTSANKIVQLDGTGKIPAINGSQITNIVGIPPIGGSTGQVLSKNSGTNYDYTWANPSSGGLPVGGATGQALTKNSGTNYDAGWSTISGGSLPHGFQEFRLTLTSGLPITVSDVTSATTIYCTPYKGDSIALYDGGAWNVRTSTEFSLALGTLTSGKPYDIFCYDNSGTPTLESLAWTNSTTRATALAYQNGILVKSGDPTRRYLGSFYTTSTTTTEDSSAKRNLWNYYHRVARTMRVNESSTGWNYTTATWRQANANSANQLEVMVGVAEDALDARTYCRVSNSNVNVAVRSGMGIDSTSAVSADCIVGGWYSQSSTVNMAVYSSLKTILSAGRHAITWLEYSAATGTTTCYASNADASSYVGGIHATVFA